jgi:hypothetical protein
LSPLPCLPALICRPCLAAPFLALPPFSCIAACPWLAANLFDCPRSLALLQLPCLAGLPLPGRPFLAYLAAFPCQTDRLFVTICLHFMNILTAFAMHVVVGIQEIIVQMVIKSTWGI